MGNCVSLCVSFRQMAGLERVFGCAGRVLSPVTRSKAAEHVRRGLRASAKSSVLGGLSQANRVMTSKPTVSNRVIRCSVSVERTRFPWTTLWANEAGRPEGIGDESGEGWPEGGGGDGGGGAGDGRGATRAVECAREDGDRAAALEGRGARDGVARDAGAGARARAVAADLSRGRGERIQTPGHASGRARAQAGAGEGRRADDEARDRGVVPRKKRLRGGVAEVEALRGAVSPGTEQRYTVTLICDALSAPRHSVS